MRPWMETAAALQVIKQRERVDVLHDKDLLWRVMGELRGVASGSGIA
jgi:hypothetical protein